MCKIIVVTGATASGKTSLIKRVMIEKNNKKIIRIKTCTDREKRQNENEEDYYFKTKEEFTSEIMNNALIEYYTNNNGDRYGTLKSEIDLSSDNVYIVTLNLSGLNDLKEYLDSEEFNMNNFYHIHIYASAELRMTRILNYRDIEKDEELYKYCRRMLENSEEEETLNKNADFIIANEKQHDRDKIVSFLNIFCEGLSKRQF